MICHNPNCEKFEKETMTYNLIVGNDSIKKCNYCLEPIDLDKQVVPNDTPFIKRKSWLNEWKFVNSGTHADQIKMKPTLNQG